MSKVTDWGREVLCYLREARSPRALVALLQVRLSLSKVGRWVCPRPVVRWVHLRSLGPVALRSHTSDISVLNELLVWKGYVVPAGLVGEPGVVVDLGANTGLAARWFLRRWPSARVVSVEPEPGNLAVLRRNLAGQCADHRAVVVPAAVGAESRRALLHTVNREFGYTIVGPPTGDAVDVQVVPMATVLAAGAVTAVDLLKVDVEGAEREIFADCGGWIGLVNSMIVECHADYGVDNLLADCRRGGAEFSVVDLDDKPEFGFSVVTARRIASG